MSEADRSPVNAAGEQPRNGTPGDPRDVGYGWAGRTEARQTKPVATTDGIAASTLRDYIGVLQRRKVAFLLPLVLVPVVALLVSLRQPAL